MLFTFNSFWKTFISLVVVWLGCEFVGFELTTVTLLTLLLCKNTGGDRYLI